MVWTQFGTSCSGSDFSLSMAKKIWNNPPLNPPILWNLGIFFGSVMIEASNLVVHIPLGHLIKPIPKGPGDFASPQETNCWKLIFSTFQKGMSSSKPPSFFGGFSLILGDIHLASIEIQSVEPREKTPLSLAYLKPIQLGSINPNRPQTGSVS